MHAATPDWEAYARLALDEDEARNDVTTALFGAGADHPAVACLRAEGDFVVAGLPIAHAVLHHLQPTHSVSQSVQDGDWVRSGEPIALLHASAGALLAGERVILNFMQRLSGIATATRRAVDAVAGTGAEILDTRKTTPGLRHLEKYAVRVGGGVNHRGSLADGVLWKDNHWALLEATGGRLADALAGAPSGSTVQVEVETEAQLREAVTAGVTSVLVDNQPPETVRAWKRLAGAGVAIEASGGIRPEAAGAYAAAGADRISMGALTSSPADAPIKLELRFDSD